MWAYNYSNELYHHGVKGQKWGVRRYQNADGTPMNRSQKRQYKRDKRILETSAYNVVRSSIKYDMTKTAYEYYKDEQSLTFKNQAMVGYHNALTWYEYDARDFIKLYGQSNMDRLEKHKGKWNENNVALANRLSETD